MLIARDYQSYGVTSLFDYFRKNAGNPVIAMPTGTGKSVVIAIFLQQIFCAWPRQRIMVLTHVKELIAQNHAKLMELWPQAPAGIHSAGLNKKDVLHNILFAGIASVAKKAHLFGHIDLILIDEAHLVSPSDETMYQAFIAALRNVNPMLKVIGLTATPWRLGHGRITEDGIFTDLCCDMTTLEAFNWFIEQGYLCPLVPKRTQSLLDTSGVHLRGGEFVANELQAAIDKTHITEAALREAMELGYGRHSWLLFCAGVEHAIHVADILTSLGVRCKAVHSKMKDSERDATIAEWKRGELQAIANNNVMTTGIDHPPLDLIVMLRPTQSPVLWVQMLGRGTRPLYAHGFDLSHAHGRLEAIRASQKQNCLVLDFAGNTKRLGPINDPVIPRKKGEKGGGEAPVKCCEFCGVWNHASARLCVHCGAEFPAPVLKIKTTAATDELIKVAAPIVEVFEVDHVTYSLHTKRNAGPGDAPMLRVMYYCGLRNFSEFIALEHPNAWVRSKAVKWWKERSDVPVPSTTHEALSVLSTLKVATHLEVWSNKKYPEIMRHCLDGSAFGRQEPRAVEPKANIYHHQPRSPLPNAAQLADMDDDIPF